MNVSPFSSVPLSSRIPSSPPPLPFFCPSPLTPSAPTPPQTSGSGSRGDSKTSLERLLWMRCDKPRQMVAWITCKPPWPLTPPHPRPFPIPKHPPNLLLLVYGRCHLFPPPPPRLLPTSSPLPLLTRWLLVLPPSSSLNRGPDVTNNYTYTYAHVNSTHTHTDTYRLIQDDSLVANQHVTI